MQINKLHKFYGNSFKDIFKSITFDNGNEFSRWKDMEIKPNTKEQRTKIYLGRSVSTKIQRHVLSVNRYLASW